MLITRPGSLQASLELGSEIVRLATVYLLSASISAGALVIWRPLDPNLWWGISLLTGVFLCLVIRVMKASTKNFFVYKGVRVFCIQERRNVWSTHLGGYRSTFWKGLVSRLCLRKPEGIKLLSDWKHRQHLAQLTLEGFTMMLQTLNPVPGAVLISASVLNHPDRNERRLADRVRVLEQQPDWQYCVINRRLPRLESLVGRLLFGWPVRAGESFTVVLAPGVVAWRVSDQPPSFKKLRLSKVAPETLSVKVSDYDSISN